MCFLSLFLLLRAAASICGSDYSTDMGKRHKRNRKGNIPRQEKCKEVMKEIAREILIYFYPNHFNFPLMSCVKSAPVYALGRH